MVNGFHKSEMIDEIKGGKNFNASFYILWNIKEKQQTGF